MLFKAVRHRKRLFDWIRYRAPKGLGNGNPIESLTGIDTEAFTTGRPFMFCTSDGDIIAPSSWPSCLFTRRFRGRAFGVWNLKYDSGAFLCHLPIKKLNALRRDGRMEHANVRYRYIPHKMLRISFNKHVATFWDVAQFYGGGLHYNTKKYLGWEIEDVADKRHTPKSIRKNWLAIAKGCKQSALATSQLMKLSLDEMRTIGLRPTALYSMATISQRHFRENAPTIDVERFWRSGKRTLQFAMESYHGGKFEVLRRGKFDGYLYDINDAYASIIRNLIDIRDCEVVQDSHYHKGATYGFLKVAVDIRKDIPHPFAVPMLGVKIYPCGKFVTYTTKREYEFMKRLKVKMEILDGQWLYCKTKSTPYRAVIDNMSRIKAEYKTSNPVLSKLAKGINNSFYGKWLQLTPEGDNHVRAGAVWNPIYASITTSEIRLKVCEAQLILGPTALAIHADSIISTRALPSSLVGNNPGQWGLKSTGSGVIIGNGIYQIADKVAFRGFDLRDGTKWTDILSKMGSDSTFELPSRRVTSWLQAAVQDRPDDINKFVSGTRKIDLNADVKRLWMFEATGRSLLKGLQDSAPVVVV